MSAASPTDPASITPGGSTAEEDPTSGTAPAAPAVADALAELPEERDASMVVEQATPTTRRKSGSAPPEESSTARAARQVDMQLDLLSVAPSAAASSTSSSLEPETGAADAAASTTTSAAAVSKPSKASKNEKTERRRSTRTTAKDKQAAKASGSAANEDEDEMALLPPTTTLLFTTSPPPTMTLFKAPSLPVTLQTLIEVPEFRILNEGELPMGRLRIQPNSGQQTDFSDEYYLRRHLAGEMLERKGRKQERDRLIIERNRIKHQVEQLRLEVASASFFANASPIKGISASHYNSPSSSTASKNNASSSNAASLAQAPGVASATGNGRQSTPTVSERIRESERNKRKQLQEAEETLRRYDELLQPREPFVTFSANGTNGAVSNAPRTWLTGGKGKFSSAYTRFDVRMTLMMYSIQPFPSFDELVRLNVRPALATARSSNFIRTIPAVSGVPPAPEGISPSDFLNAPRGAALASLHQQAAQQVQQQQPTGRGSGSAIVAQRRLAQAGSGSGPSSGTAIATQGRSASSNGAKGSAEVRVTRSRQNSPAVFASSTSYSPIQPAAPVASTSSLANSNTTPTRFIPILPRPSPSGSNMPSDRRATSVTSVTASGPSSLTLKIRQGGLSTSVEHDTSMKNTNVSDGALAHRRRTRALQPIDISLSRDANYPSQYGANGSLKRSAADSIPPGTASWQPLGTGQIRPRKRRRRRRRRGESSEEDDGAREAELEMEASMEFIDGQPDEYSYINNLKSSYAAAFDHTLPLGTPDDPDEMYVDRETPRVVSSSSRRASLPVVGRRNGSTKKSQLKDGAALKQVVPATATGTFRSTEVPAVFEDTTDYSDGTMRPPPGLPSIHIDRASSASLSMDEPVRRAGRPTSTRASTPSGSTLKKHQQGRIPRQLFHRPDKPVEALLERNRLLTSDGRRGSPLPPRSSNLASEPAPRLTAIEKAAMTFESEGDLSSLPSETDEGGEASEFHDSESRFKSERALWKLETADTAAPAFLGSKGASHGAADLATSVLPDEVDDSTANSQLATMLDPSALATLPRKRGRPPRSAASATPDSNNIPTQVAVGGLKTRKRPHLDDFPVNDLNEIAEADMYTLRKSYEHVAARKKDMMGAKFLEMPVGDWQVYTPESDIRHT